MQILVKEKIRFSKAFRLLLRSCDNKVFFNTNVTLNRGQIEVMAKRCNSHYLEYILKYLDNERVSTYMKLTQ